MTWRFHHNDTGLTQIYDIAIPVSIKADFSDPMIRKENPPLPHFARITLGMTGLDSLIILRPYLVGRTSSQYPSGSLMK